jgi:2-alkyl-3-oxoalkanoate reductase
VTRVMMTGATGFVGGRIAWRLRERGDEVIAVVRTPSAELEALGATQVTGGFDAIDAALLEGVGAIVHAAAGVGPDLEQARVVNRDGTRRVVDAALAAGTPRLVHISTTSVYDLDAIGDVEVAEDAPLATEASGSSPAGNAPGAYSVTKAEAEAEVTRGTQAGLSAAILRPPAVLGAGASSTWGTTVPARLRDGGFGERNPDATFGWVHIEDLVDAVLAALDQQVEVTANVVGGHAEWRTYLEEVARLVGARSVPLDAHAPAWRGRYATDRLPEALGVTPTRSFGDAMAEIAASWADGTP